MYVSDTPETLKQVKVVKPGSKLTHAKFEIPRLHSVQETVCFLFCFLVLLLFVFCLFAFGEVNSVVHQLHPLNTRESKNKKISGTFMT